MTKPDLANLRVLSIGSVALCALLLQPQPRPLNVMASSCRRGQPYVTSILLDEPRSSGLATASVTEPNIAAQLKALLEEVPVDTVAALCGVTRQTYHRWLTGASPTLDRVHFMRTLIGELSHLKAAGTDIVPLLVDREIDTPAALIRAGRFDALKSLIYSGDPVEAGISYRGTTLRSIPSVAAVVTEVAVFEAVDSRRDRRDERVAEVYRDLDNADVQAFGAFIVG